MADNIVSSYFCTFSFILLRISLQEKFSVREIFQSGVVISATKLQYIPTRLSTIFAFFRWNLSLSVDIPSGNPYNSGI